MDVALYSLFLQRWSPRFAPRAAAGSRTRRATGPGPTTPAATSTPTRVEWWVDLCELDQRGQEQEVLPASACRGWRRSSAGNQSSVWLILIIWSWPLFPPDCHESLLPVSDWPRPVAHVPAHFPGDILPLQVSCRTRVHLWVQAEIFTFFFGGGVFSNLLAGV